MLGYTSENPYNPYKSKKHQYQTDFKGIFNKWKSLQKPYKTLTCKDYYSLHIKFISY